MRWFARRLVFYVFAIWVALTINFLLPRMMPGSPIDGILQHLTPAQLAANPGIVKTYEALVGGGNNSIWQDYVTYLHRISHFDFGISTSNYPTPVSEVVGREVRLLPVTSSTKDSVRCSPLYVRLEEWESAGLSRPCLVTRKVVIVDVIDVTTVVGALGTADRARVFGEPSAVT